MSNNERFDRLTALLKEAGLKQDKVLTEIRELHKEIIEQNSVLEQMQNSLTRTLADTTATSSELTNLLKETTNLVELLSTDNRAKSRITSILDLLPKP